MKRIVAMMLSVAIVAAVAIGTTVAYFTDSDEETNIFTVGNVDIELLEEQRDWSVDSDGLVNKTTTLEDFEQYKKLMPIVTDLNEDGETVVKRDDLGMNLAQNYQDKIVSVKNTGESDAWVRIFVAVPAALENRDTPADSVLHWDVGEYFDASKNGKFNSSNEGNPFTAEFGTANYVATRDIVGDGTEYNIYSFTRKTALKAGETTAAAVVGFYLDERVDRNNDDGYNYLGSKGNLDNRITVKGVGAKKDTTTYHDAYSFDGGVLIPVFAEAVQTAGFETPTVAFARAIEAGLTDPYDPWTAGNASIELPDAIKTVDDFVTALNKLPSARGDQKIVLAPNKVYDFKGKSFSNGRIANASSITIEGNNAVIINLSQPLIAYSYNPTSVTIKNLTIRSADMSNEEHRTANDDVGTRAQFYGAFIGVVTGYAKDITLSNCHLENSKIASTQNRGGGYDGNGVGGLIGYCQPSDSTGTITIANCSVVGSTIAARKAVGAIVGAVYTNGVNQQAEMNITNTTVKNCSLESGKNNNNEDTWRVGTIIGSMNAVKITATNFVRSGCTLKQDPLDGTKPEINDANYLDTYGVYYGGKLTVNSKPLL